MCIGAGYKLSPERREYWEHNKPAPGASRKDIGEYLSVNLPKLLGGNDWEKAQAEEEQEKEDKRGLDRLLRGRTRHQARKSQGRMSSLLGSSTLLGE